MPAPSFPIEKGASLRVLRPTKFVEPDQTIFLENSKSFTDATGVGVRVDFAAWEDLRPQTAVAANVGTGPDIVVGWTDDPHLYASKLVELGDLNDYLGKKYGGWAPLAERLGKEMGTNRWIAMPMGGSGGPMVYRESWVKEAGFATPPTTLDGFLDLCRKLKANKHPAGFALGNAVGDGNSFCHWLVWSHGGAMTDEDSKVTINSKETRRGAEIRPGPLRDLHPRHPLLARHQQQQGPDRGRDRLTQNGVSLYFSMKNSKDPATQAIAADINHARMPIGPVGRSTETALVLNSMIFQYSKYPMAAKAYLKHMMEQEQYDRWLTGCLGYWGQPLMAYAQSDVWSSDPKILPYRDTMEKALWLGYKGPISEASGAVVADYIMVQMVSSVCAGQASRKRPRPSRAPRQALLPR